MRSQRTKMLHAPCPLLRDSNGFTLMEVMVSVSIFATVIVLMLSLFNYSLRIQRRTEALRQVSQNVRSVTEFLVKEIRNGQIDYGIKDGEFLESNPFVGSSNCPAAVAGWDTLGTPTYGLFNYGVVLYNIDGERECVYWDNNSSSPTFQSVMIHKENYAADSLHTSNVKVTMLKFYVRPQKDPYTTAGAGLVETQPSVTIVLKAQVTLPTQEIREIYYQTSVSTNIYNIPNE